MRVFISISLALLLTVPVVSLNAQSTIRNGKMAVTSAKVRLKFKKYDEALEMLKEGERVEPDYAPIYPLLGSLYLQKHDYIRADSAFKKAVSLDPKLEKEVHDARLQEWSNLVNQGVQAMKEKKFDKSISLLKDATIIYPEGVEAYINLGASYTNSGQQRLAVGPFHKALEINPGDTEVKLDLAKVYDVLGRPDSAKVFYRQVLEDNPDDSSVKEALAACYLREGSLDSSSAIYSELLTVKDVDPNVAFNAGLLEIQRENWPAAEKAFKITLEKNPDDVEAQENLSIAMMQQEKYKEVIPHLEAIVKLDEKNKEAWGSLIIAYAQLGMSEKAKEANEKYKELGGD